MFPSCSQGLISMKLYICPTQVRNPDSKIRYEQTFFHNKLKKVSKKFGSFKNYV